MSSRYGRGRIRVAKYVPGKPVPKTRGFKNVLIHTSPSVLGGDLSPYVLRDEDGHLIENIWQFSKIYHRVSAQRTPLGKFHMDTIVWEHAAEQHIGKGKKVLPAYWKWRRKGFANKYAVRYPAGFFSRRSAVASLWMVNGELKWLSYIEARKHIYCKEYARLAPRTNHFRALSVLLDKGINLQIVEVDGPDPALTYWPYTMISVHNPGLLIDEAVIKFLLNDPGKSFGHGYTIAALLLGRPDWLEPDNAEDDKE